MSLYYVLGTLYSVLVHQINILDETAEDNDKSWRKLHFHLLFYNFPGFATFVVEGGIHSEHVFIIPKDLIHGHYGSVVGNFFRPHLNFSLGVLPVELKMETFLLHSIRLPSQDACIKLNRAALPSSFKKLGGSMEREVRIYPDFI